ncbi:MAG: Xaa-Pro peptidase family protein [Eubacteriales bacterium]|nr:Xaa-Pro peptidase family protein [Eubacteriales bacterium]
MNINRVTNVLKKMGAMDLKQLLITDPMSINYLTGYYTFPHERFLGLLLRADGNHVLFLNKLFFLTQDPGVELSWHSDTDPVMDMVAEYLLPGETLGVDKLMAAKFLVPLMDNEKTGKIVLGSICVDEARGAKDAEEIEKMREASRINDLAMDRLKKLIRPGVTEIEIADQLLDIYKELGADGHSFDPIVAFGPNGADGHHSPDNTVLKEGDSIIFDVGCIKNGYCSDMTRTFFAGVPSERDRQVYETCLKAHKEAIAMIKPGIPLSSIDGTARGIITAAGYGKEFNHRLGHFIGQEVHEFGDVSSKNERLTEPGMIFSIEPGIYLRDEMGVRIENLVVVTEDGVEELNHYTREFEDMCVDF